jgi:hypothetical protein
MDFLYFPCPAVDCTNKKVTFWYHARCSSNILIRYKDIFIVCGGCEKSAILFNWKFSCGDHEFRDASRQGCLIALAIMGLPRGNKDQIKVATLAILQN